MDDHAVFHSNNGKRQILVVEDEAVNREMLGYILEKDYTVLFAADGEEAIRKIQENKEFLSLILLDLIMPKLSGIQVLRKVRSSAEYQDIPIIVASGDQSQEIECLNSGASDFIQKPYPEPGVILARVHRAIELFESRQIIESTERDNLTGLYNWEYFLSYAEQFDQHHPDTDMDAILLDINNFRTINERYGRAFADDVLRRVGDKAREIVHDEGGIVSRRGGDVFLIYCPHRNDYKAILDNASIGLTEELDASSRVRLRMGVYSKVDKTLDMERRFDRAKMAADSVRNSYTRNIGVYDDSLHKAELYSMQLIDDFPKAIEERQFKVFFQPKYKIQSEKPVLAGAEALVRWFHPELKMVSPGVFIPLFEENGLIEALDHYVWKEAARQVRIWKDEIGISVPVSVNVSRVDLGDPDIIYTLLGILEENKLEPGDLHLELTESAYAKDTEHIIEMVKRFRSMGFLVEMDDFGTGYSSLNMLSTLPIDVLKLDMKFIQTAFSEEKNTEMISIIIEIARHLSAPVVAEGVETEEQLNALKELGCDIVQGYYFSPPVSPEKFEPFLHDLKQSQDTEQESVRDSKTEKKQTVIDSLKRWGEQFNISLRSASVVFLILALISAAALLTTDTLVNSRYHRMEQINERYIEARQSAINLEIGSDVLTASVQNFVSTGNIDYLEDYFREANETQRRDIAVKNLRSLGGNEAEAFTHLNTALSLSNELMELEYSAMRYILSAGNYDPARIPDVLKQNPLSEEEENLSAEEKKAKAMDLVFGQEYEEYKRRIRENTSISTEKLILEANEQRMASDREVTGLLFLQTILTFVMLMVVLVILFFIHVWVRLPLSRMVEQMKAKENVLPSGAGELRFVSETYNSIFEENRRTHERLTYGNMHDALTGLYNRAAYDFMRHDLDMSHNALLLVDVDKFKSVNDTYGHNVGDLVLKRVGEVLKYSFRDTDLVFRLGGDEFVVIMSNVTNAKREQVRTRIEQANVMLQKPNDDIPPVSLSVGVAFADRENPEGDIFKDADTALYRMKESGRCGCYIY